MLVIDKDRWARGWMQVQEATNGSCNSPINAIRQWRPSERQRPWTPKATRVECVLLHIGQPDNCCCALSALRLQLL